MATSQTSTAMPVSDTDAITLLQQAIAVIATSVIPAVLSNMRIPLQFSPVAMHLASFGVLATAGAPSAPFEPASAPASSCLPGALVSRGSRRRVRAGVSPPWGTWLATCWLPWSLAGWLTPVTSHAPYASPPRCCWAACSSTRQGCPC